MAKLAPIADMVAANLIKRGVDLADPMTAEDILDTINILTGGDLDWEPTNIVFSMVEKRMKAATK